MNQTMRSGLSSALLFLLFLNLASLSAGDARGDCVEQVESISAPANTFESKLSFIETMVNRQENSKSGAGKDSFGLTTKNERILARALKRWNVEKGLNQNDLYQIIDALYIEKNLGGTWLSPNKQAIVRRRWQTEILTKGIYETIVSENLVPHQLAEPFSRKVLAITKVLLYGPVMSLLARDVTKTVSARQDVDQFAWKIDYIGADRAYAQYAEAASRSAVTQIGLNYVRKMVLLAMAFSGIWQTAVSIDRNIMPVEALWVTHQMAVQQILIESEKEYQDEFHSSMSAQMHKYIYDELNQESLRTLLVQERQTHQRGPEGEN